MIQQLGKERDQESKVLMVVAKNKWRIKEEQMQILNEILSGNKEGYPFANHFRYQVVIKHNIATNIVQNLAYKSYIA